jgi:hypothetical protein
MNWVYSIQYSKEGTGLLQGIKTIKTLIQGGEEIASQVVSFSEFVENTSEDYQITLYEEAKAEINLTLNILFPEGDPPVLQPGLGRTPGSGHLLGRAVSSIIELGVMLQVKREMKSQ